MENWTKLCSIISEVFENNSDLNFGIKLTPEQVAYYLTHKVLFTRITPSLTTALFVTTDGECGFASLTPTKAEYKFIINEFYSFVVELPKELRAKLWCKVQVNNPIINKLALRLGFVLDSSTELANYYVLKGE